jgi:hypothetical protein
MLLTLSTAPSMAEIREELSHQIKGSTSEECGPVGWIVEGFEIEDEQ